MRAAAGKEVKLEIQEKPTTEMRKYFEGCLVPAFFYLHPGSGWRDFADAREVLKLEFVPGVRTIEDTEGNSVRIAPSTADIGKQRFSQMVEAITDWMRNNGVEEALLDSEEYKRWRDTNFDDPYYPPLRRVKELYEKEKGA
jgi:hypothetical protein